MLVVFKREIVKRLVKGEVSRSRARGGSRAVEFSSLPRAQGTHLVLDLPCLRSQEFLGEAWGRWAPSLLFFRDTFYWALMQNRTDNCSCITSSFSMLILSSQCCVRKQVMLVPHRCLLTYMRPWLST